MGCMPQNHNGRTSSRTTQGILDGIAKAGKHVSPDDLRVLKSLKQKLGLK